MTTRRFQYAIDKRYLPMLLLMLLRPSHDGVVLTDDDLVATFGLVKITTPRANITGAHITRNYRWWTACGIRMSYVDDGLTLGPTAMEVSASISRRKFVRRCGGAAIRR